MLFKLIIAGRGYATGKWEEVNCVDYNMENGLVRYKDVVYDIRTGLWVVELSWIQSGCWTWSGCGKVKDLKMSNMLETVVSNAKFMEKVERRREEVKDIFPTLNEVVKPQVLRNLFDFI